VSYLLAGGNNAMITLQHGVFVPLPYQEMINPVTGRTTVRNVNTRSFRYQSAYKFMTRLKPGHAHNDKLFEKMAAFTHLTAEELKRRYGYILSELKFIL
jgi:6-phosphofructokinase 1